MNLSKIERSDDYFIHSYEIDLTARLRFSALNRYLQESAWKNAEQLGFGFGALFKKDLAWVLTRMVISVDHLPGWNETIRIATWPSGKDTIFAYRDFQFFDTSGIELGRATTSWCVIDLRTRKPVLISDAFDHDLAELDKQMFDERPAKLAEITRTDLRWSTIVGYQDLDVNEHVTNSRYIDWIFESFDLDFLKKHRVQNLAINFQAEALYGYEVNVQTEKVSDLEYRHFIIQKRNNLEICRAETVWK